MKKNIKTIYIRITFSQSKEHYAFKFIRNFEGFTKEKYSFVLIWKARNIRSLFNLKDKTSRSHYLYCMRENVTVSKILSLQQGERWDEHNDKGKNSEPAKHLYQFPEHSFNWNVLRRVPNKLTKKYS